MPSFRSCLGFLFCLTVSITTGHAGVLHVALLAESSVQGDTIMLADLLPQNAPRQLRKIANEIPLGSAPKNGATRQFYRDAIVAAIKDAGLQPIEFVVPPVIRVHRLERTLTAEEAFAAIRAARAQNPNVAIPDFRLQDISFDATIEVPPGEPRLEVTKMVFDQQTGRTSFRLVAHSAHGIVPFYVTARTRTDESATSVRVARAKSLTGDQVSATASAMLVDPRTPAILYLHSPDSYMIISVRPLQRGRLGENIRVRLPANGKTLIARVTGSGRLDATF